MSASKACYSNKCVSSTTDTYKLLLLMLLLLFNFARWPFNNKPNHGIPWTQNNLIAKPFIAHPQPQWEQYPRCFPLCRLSHVDAGSVRVRSATGCSSIHLDWTGRFLEILTNNQRSNCCVHAEIEPWLSSSSRQ